MLNREQALNKCIRLITSFYGISFFCNKDITSGRSVPAICVIVTRLGVVFDPRSTFVCRPGLFETNHSFGMAGAIETYLSILGRIGRAPGTVGSWRGLSTLSNGKMASSETNYLFPTLPAGIRK